MSLADRSRLWLELAMLYVALPFVIALAYRLSPVPLVALLAPILVLVIALLSRAPEFSWRELLRTGVSRSQLVQIAALFILLGSAMTAFVFMYLPGEFLSFPRKRPYPWLAVMVIYPLVSVTAQELMFRVLFRFRYGELFSGNLRRVVVVNAALFAFAHIVFWSWITILVSFAGGLIFAWRYFTTQSFWAVVLEHSLYGTLIFTVGLGRYFLAGVPFS